MAKYAVEPLLAVGMEGLFGSVTMLIGMPFIYEFLGTSESAQGGIFDLLTGWNQGQLCNSS